MRSQTVALLVAGCALMGWAAAPASAAAAAAAAPDPAPAEGLERCFREDSISCVQKHVFRSVKAFFDQEKIELPGGVSLVRESPASENAAAAEAEAVAEAEAETEEARVLGDASGDVERREEALEAFAVRRAQRFLEERRVRLDLSPLVRALTQRARALVAVIPPEVRQRVIEFAAAEARGKKKKLSKLLPLLLVGGLKVAGLLGLAYLGIGLLAKKAILVSLVSIAISGFVALKKLLSHGGGVSYAYGGGHGYEAYPSHGWSGGSVGYSSPGGTFDISGYSGGHGEYASHSSPVGHAVAYSAHKPGAR